MKHNGSNFYKRKQGHSNNTHHSYRSRVHMVVPQQIFRTNIKKSHHWLIFYRFEVLILISQNASMASFLYTSGTPSVELGWHAKKYWNVKAKENKWTDVGTSNVTTGTSVCNCLSIHDCSSSIIHNNYTFLHLCDPLFVKHASEQRNNQKLRKVIC